MRSCLYHHNLHPSSSGDYLSHVAIKILMVRKDDPLEKMNEYSMAPVQPANTEVTHCVMEFPQG